MKFKFLLLCLIIPLFVSAQQDEDKDTPIILANNLGYYGLKPSNYPPRQLLGFDFYNFALIWKHDLNQKEPLYGLPSSNKGEKYYFKNEFSDIEKGKTRINVQLALDGFNFKKGDTTFLVKPRYSEEYKNLKISDLFRDILPQLVTSGPENDNQSIYLSILTGDDLNDYGLLDDEFVLASFYIYLIWNNTDNYKLPVEFEKASHVLLYGKDRPIHYQEKMPIEIAEDNTSKTESANGEQEQDDKLKKENSEKTIEETTTVTSSEEVNAESIPEVSTIEINNEKALNFFQDNLTQIKGFNKWKATNSGKIAFFDCSVALPNDQILIDQQNLNFDVIIEANNQLTAFETLAEENLLKSELPGSTNSEEKHTNNKHISQKLKNLFQTHLGLEKAEMQVTVSNDEKNITINNLRGSINGMLCFFSPIEVPLKYVDHFILARFDSTVIYDNVSVDISDVLSQLTSHTNTGLEVPIDKSRKTINFSPLLYGHQNGIKIKMNDESSALYITGQKLKNNYLTIYYSLDQHFTVMVVYPHFFQNKRDLTRVIDEKMQEMNEKNGKFLIYLASEFNPKVFKTEDDRRLVLQTLAQMYGNLIPSFTSDYQHLLTTNNNYLGKLNNSKNVVSAEYSFFVPPQFWPEFKEKFLGDIDVNNQGNMIIPKNFIENSLPQTTINLYFPKDSNHIQPGEINNYKCNVFEI